MIDLKALAHGLRWRVTLDPSDAQSPRSERPWMYQVAGRYGHVYPHGVEQLAASCHANRVKPKLLALPGAKLIRDGDRECIITFPTDQLDIVCQVLRCRRRKVLTPEQRARLVEMGTRNLSAIAKRQGRESPDAAP